MTLLHWTEPTPVAHAGPGFLVDRQPRWTAACDCGWHSTHAGSHPNEVLAGYSHHLDDDPGWVLRCTGDQGRDEIDRALLLRRIDAVASEPRLARQLLNDHRDLWAPK